MIAQSDVATVGDMACGVGCNHRVQGCSFFFFFTLRVEKSFLDAEVKQRVPFRAVQPLRSKLQGTFDAIAAAATAVAAVTFLALMVVSRPGFFVSKDSTAQAVGWRKTTSLK